MAEFRVAILGSTGRGDYGHGLDSIWRNFSNCEVVAVADPDEPGRQQARERTGAARAPGGLPGRPPGQHPAVMPADGSPRRT